MFNSIILTILIIGTLIHHHKVSGQNITLRKGRQDDNGCGQAGASCYKDWECCSGNCGYQYGGWVCKGANDVGVTCDTGNDCRSGSCNFGVCCSPNFGGKCDVNNFATCCNDNNAVCKQGSCVPSCDAGPGESCSKYSLEDQGSCCRGGLQCENNICCNQNGGSCSSNNECCNGNCKLDDYGSGSCSCKEPGSPCRKTEECCDFKNCQAGVCGCKNEGVYCGRQDECCSYRCAGGRCGRKCISGGQRCYNKNDCCPSYKCADVYTNVKECVPDFSG